MKAARQHFRALKLSEDQIETLTTKGVDAEQFYKWRQFINIQEKRAAHRQLPHVKKRPFV